jgi:CheY-like chemotaxis protein
MSEAIRAFRILLVEDDPADATLAKRALREWEKPTEIFHVTDGVDCLNFLRREGELHKAAPRPDLILLDLNMPRMNGREALKEIKADESLRSIPVVILTTSDFEQDVLRSYDLGANSFITKPVDLNKFFHIIGQIEKYWFSLVKLPR